jgi:hypothetical protein
VLLNPFSQGQFGALLNVSPDFVLTERGEFSLMGGAAAANQVTLGGVRVPTGIVVGATRGNILTSPWDVSTGGAAGATVAIEQPPGSRFGSVYAILRTSASGVSGGGATAPRDINVPLQVTGRADGATGRLGHSTDVFASRTATAQQRWDIALTAGTRALLDSFAVLAQSPTVLRSTVASQFGVISRLDWLPADANAQANSARTRADYVTVALSRSASDAGLRGQYATGSTGYRSRQDVGVLQFDSRRILRNRYRLASTLSTTATRTTTDRRSEGPSIQLSDGALGGIVQLGSAPPQPPRHSNSAEARTQMTWYSATNSRRYLLQVQARIDAMANGAAAPHSSYVVATPEALRSGIAISGSRTAGAAATSAKTLMVAPAASVGFDLGRRGSALIGIRADGWQAHDVSRTGTLRGLDLSPRIGVQHAVGRRKGNRGDWATLRAGAGRFVDWPSLEEWFPAWGSTRAASSACTGDDVMSLVAAESASACRAPATIITTPALDAARALRPTSSVRAEASLSIHRLTRFVRADIGIASTRFDRMLTLLPALRDAAVPSRLAGEGDRALLIESSAISPSGIVPRAALRSSAPTPLLASEGWSRGTQYRVRLATRDVWTRTQLELNYAWNTGRQRTIGAAPQFSAPGLVTARATGNRHSILASLGSFVGIAQVRAAVIVRSGVRFTPLADRDVNGDGLANDAAYVSSDQASTWAASVPSALRTCIRGAAGRVFRPNECSGPWTVASNVFAQLPGPYVGLPRGTEVHLQVSNPTSLLAGIGGFPDVVWGSAGFVDPRLSRITGFDATSQRFSAEVIGAFGKPVGLSRTVTDPAAVAISVRIPLGRSSFAKRIDQAIVLLARDRADSTRRAAADLTINLLPNVPDIFLTELRNLTLTGEQRSELAALSRQWAMVTPAAIARVAPTSAADLRARVALLDARSDALRTLTDIIVKIRSLLTAQQLSQLEPYEASLLNLRVFRWAESSAYPF